MYVMSIVLFSVCESQRSASSAQQAAPTADARTREAVMSMHVMSIFTHVVSLEALQTPESSAQPEKP